MRDERPLAQGHGHHAIMVHHLKFVFNKAARHSRLKHKAGSSFRLHMVAFYDLSENDKFKNVRVYSVYHEDYQVK